jgi:hypothetical protein
MKRLLLLALLPALLLSCSDEEAAPSSSVSATNPPPAMERTACPVTRPPDPPLTPPEEMIAFLRTGSSNPDQFRPLGPGQFFYGNDGLWLSLPEDGVVWNQKQPWWRAMPGKLRIEGRRLDGSHAGVVPVGEMVPVAHVPDGYGGRGFQATGWAFPSPGCWEIGAHVDESKIRLVLWVIEPPATAAATPAP